MLQSILFIITFFSGFICLISIFFREKSGNFILVNKFLIGLFIFTDFRFLGNALVNLYPSLQQYYVHTYISIICLIIMPPGFYLYLCDVVFNKKWEMKRAFHFPLPILLFVLFIYFFIAKNYNNINTLIYLSLGISIYYAFLIYRLLAKHIWNRKSDIKAVQNQNQIIYNWTLFLFLCNVIMIAGRLLSWLFLPSTNNLFFFIDNLKWFHSIVWLIIFSIVLIKPEILYGYNYLNKMVDLTEKNNFLLREVWNIDYQNKIFTSQKEELLSEKMNTLIPTYIHKLENISLYSEIFRNHEYTINELSLELKIPVSHINYMFKFHCNESFTNFKKIVRIHDAVNLINKGYLKNSTIESLATTVGFVAYSTFSVAFKDITGSTAHDYGV